MRTGEKLNKTEWVRVLFGAVLCPQTIYLGHNGLGR